VLNVSLPATPREQIFLELRAQNLTPSLLAECTMDISADGFLIPSRLARRAGPRGRARALRSDRLLGALLPLGSSTIFIGNRVPEREPDWPRSSLRIGMFYASFCYWLLRSLADGCPLCLAPLLLSGSRFSPGPLPLHRLPKEIGSRPISVVRTIQHLAGGVLVVQGFDDERNVFVGDFNRHSPSMALIGALFTSPHYLVHRRY
jgi:hypothetical protein